MKRYTFLLIIFGMMLGSSGTFADGLLLPNDKNYPTDFLRNRVTEISVTINGLVAETVVYQEFVNEWTSATDAVYSFPLPPDARSTMLLYTRNDTTFKAILRVEPQSPNPGTGEGGLAALVNQYIGRNGLKLQLKNIQPGDIQKVELHYISKLDYHKGESVYRYPLDTQDFVQHPIDHLEFNVTVNSAQNITGFDLPTHPGFTVLENNPNHLALRMRKPNAFLATDLEFRFSVANDVLDVDFFSATNDSLDGHFGLFVRPENQADSTDIFDKKIVFLLGNSSRMAGFKLEQSIQAISQSLDLLTPADSFNVILFNSSTERWQNTLVPATETNIADAKTFLDGVSPQFGSRLDLGLFIALQQFANSSASNAILAFTDGRSPLDPLQIQQDNPHDVGIFAIGIGDDVDRERLEMTAALNNGFVTYFDENDNLRSGMFRVFEKISQPILKNVLLNFNKTDVYSVIPQQYPTTFAGAYFFVAGRYVTPENTQLILSGDGVNGTTAVDWQIEFRDDPLSQRFTEKLWAKEMIDAIERQIAVYGDTPALKDSVIALSLRYEIRCRYTSYWADYETSVTGIVTGEPDATRIETAFLQDNYPNPFNPTTTMRLFVDAASANSIKFIKIYNMLGQLVVVIDISTLGAGWHEVRFNGQDAFGNALPSGIYFVQLQVDGNVTNTLRIHLVK